jgi:hypothetical protein
MTDNNERTAGRENGNQDNRMNFTDGMTVAATREQVSCDLSGEAVILNFQDGTYYGLNAVGAAIWDLIQVPRKVEEIRGWLLEEYAVDPPQCERDLQAFLIDLSRRKLISISN